MAQSYPDVHHKKRRRRRQDKVALNARLILDDHVKGDVGIASEDVFRDLFPHALSGMDLYLGTCMKLICQ